MNWCFKMLHVYKFCKSKSYFMYTFYANLNFDFLKITDIANENTRPSGSERIQIKYIRPDKIPMTGLPFQGQNDCAMVLLNMPIPKEDANGKVWSNQIPWHCVC